jgi:hypothetical protein
VNRTYRRCECVKKIASQSFVLVYSSLYFKPGAHKSHAISCAMMPAIARPQPPLLCAPTLASSSSPRSSPRIILPYPNSYLYTSILYPQPPSPTNGLPNQTPRFLQPSAQLAPLMRLFDSIVQFQQIFCALQVWVLFVVCCHCCGCCGLCGGVMRRWCGCRCGCGGIRAHGYEGKCCGGIL